MATKQIAQPAIINAATVVPASPSILKSIVVLLFSLDEFPVSDESWPSCKL